MRLLGALYLLSLCAGGVSAQTAPEGDAPPGVFVLGHDHSFEIQRYVPRNWEHLPEAQRATTTRPSAAAGDFRGWPSTEGARPVWKSRFIFLYSAEIKNAGGREIAGVVWEYVFVRAAGGEEVARLRFHGKAKIGAGRTSTLRGQSRERPPLPKVPPVVAVKELGKDKGPVYRGRVEIRCVSYADGTRWRHGGASAGDCESPTGSKRQGEK